METAPRIVRIVRITDTRSFVEEGDRWIAVPGTGLASNCYRCGREHEIHAEVELSDGSHVIVGTGCARGESAEVAHALRSGARDATRLASLTRQRAALQAELAAYDAERAIVNAAEVPAPTFYTENGVDRVRFGEAHGYWILPRHDREQRVSQARVAYPGDLMRTRGFRDRYVIATDLDSVTRKLRRLEAKLFAAAPTFS